LKHGFEFQNPESVERLTTFVVVVSTNKLRGGPQQKPANKRSNSPIRLDIRQDLTKRRASFRCRILYKTPKLLGHGSSAYKFAEGFSNVRRKRNYPLPHTFDH